jgi:hypothetical protein
MNYQSLQNNIAEEIKRPLKAGDWVSGKTFDTGEVMYTDGKIVRVKIVDSDEHKPGETFGFNILDLTILDMTDIEKKNIWNRVKKFQKKTVESIESKKLYEDMTYSSDRAQHHLDRIVRMSKDSSTEMADVVRYLKDVLKFLAKINWKKVKKK